MIKLTRVQTPGAACQRADPQVGVRTRQHGNVDVPEGRKEFGQRFSIPQKHLVFRRSQQDTTGIEAEYAGEVPRASVCGKIPAKPGAIARQMWICLTDERVVKPSKCPMLPLADVRVLCYGASASSRALRRVDPT
jgi:hypothetical protein